MLKGSPTDQELMALYQEGSEEAFMELYARHSGKIFGYLKSRTRSAESASELFQEVFVKVHRSKHLYKPSLPILPWLFSVTHSVLVDGARKSKKRNEVFGYDFDQLANTDTNNQNDETVQEILSQLPETQGTAVQLRYLDEKTFEEIAETLKTTPVNVRQIISRGLRNLKRFVSEGEKP